MAHILVVEDEKSINDLIAMNLALVGHTSEQAYEGNEALEYLKQGTYSLIILDIMLPGIDGFALMKHVPADTPVIFLTAMGNLSDRVKGFKLGADDYIVKPFETIELLARIEAVLRRTRRSLNIFSLDGTVINLESRVVTVNGNETELTLREDDPQWLIKAEQAVSVLLPENITITGSKVVFASRDTGVTAVFDLSDGSAIAVRLIGKSMEAAAYIDFPNGYDGSLDPKPVTENGVG